MLDSWEKEETNSKFSLVEDFTGNLGRRSQPHSLAPWSVVCFRDQVQIPTTGVIDVREKFE